MGMSKDTGTSTDSRHTPLHLATNKCLVSANGRKIFPLADWASCWVYIYNAASSRQSLFFNSLSGKFCSALCYLLSIHVSSFQMNHPVDASTSKLWTNGTDQQLQSYFSYKEFPICPLCNIILADLNELKSQHRNAPGFMTRKKDLFNPRKYISVLLHTWYIGFSSTLNPNLTFIFLKNVYFLR